MAPGTSFEAYPIPVLAEPKKIIRALDQLRSLKTFPSPDAVNTTTRPQLPKYISHALGSLYQPWKPGYLRSAYGANLDGAPTELPRLAHLCQQKGIRQEWIVTEQLLQAKREQRKSWW
jgi:hypothetical protein